MKQRLAIAGALLGSPKVLVLDEPTNGLDPVGIAEIRSLIQELNRKGHTIIMASHLLDEVEKVCTHVAILNKGKLITTGKVDEVLADEDMLEISASDNSLLMQSLQNYPGLTSFKAGRRLCVCFFWKRAVEHCRDQCILFFKRHNPFSLVAEKEKTRSPVF